MKDRPPTEEFPHPQEIPCEEQRQEPDLEEGDSPSTKTTKEFTPDSAIKKYLTELSTPKLLGIINACCGTDYPLDSSVVFGHTEYFSVLGTLDKNSVRGDFVATIQADSHQETTNQVLIEFQSTADSDMGFRMFVYSLNVSQQQESSKAYHFPKAVTIYTTLGVPKKGMDEVQFHVEHFRVGDQHFSGNQGDILTIQFPYVNILAMDFSEFQNSPLEPLQVIYPYRFCKDSKRMKTEDNFTEVLDTIRNYTLNQVGNDSIVVSGLVRELIIDLWEICRKNPEKFEKELELLEHINKSSTDLLREECEARGKIKGKIEGKIEGEIEGIIKGKIEGKIEGEIEGKIKGKIEEKYNIAKKLFGVLDHTMIASTTGLTLAQVEELHSQV